MADDSKELTSAAKDKPELFSLPVDDVGGDVANMLLQGDIGPTDEPDAGPSHQAAQSTPSPLVPVASPALTPSAAMSPGSSAIGDDDEDDDDDEDEDDDDEEEEEEDVESKEESEAFTSEAEAEAFMKECTLVAQEWKQDSVPQEQEELLQWCLQWFARLDHCLKTLDSNCQAIATLLPADRASIPRLRYRTICRSLFSQWIQSTNDSSDDEHENTGRRRQRSKRRRRGVGWKDAPADITKAADALRRLLDLWIGSIRSLDLMRSYVNEPFKEVKPPSFMANVDELLFCTALEQDVVNGLIDKNGVRSRHKMTRLVGDCVQMAFPQSRASVEVCGSMANGLAKRTSDIDLGIANCPDRFYKVAPSGKKFRSMSRDCEREVLVKLAKVLRKNRVRVQRILRARVPLLKIQRRFGLEDVSCDVTILRQWNIEKAQLIRTFTLIDPRARILMGAMKLWAKHQGINDASLGTLNSYSICLMAIQYLQMLQPPVLPCVQPHHDKEFKDLTDEEKGEILPVNRFKRFGEKNTMSIGQLFVGLLEWYAYHFNPMIHVVNVRCGKVTELRRHLPNFGFQGRRAPVLAVEDPFDDTDNAARSVDEASWKLVVKKFRDAVEAVKANPNIEWAALFDPSKSRQPNPTRGNYYNNNTNNNKNERHRGNGNRGRRSSNKMHTPPAGPQGGPTVNVAPVSGYPNPAYQPPFARGGRGGRGRGRGRSGSGGYGRGRGRGGWPRRHGGYGHGHGRGRGAHAHGHGGTRGGRGRGAPRGGPRGGRGRGRGRGRGGRGGRGGNRGRQATSQ